MRVEGAVAGALILRHRGVEGANSQRGAVGFVRIAMDSPVRKVEVLKRPGGKSPYWYLRWWELTPDGSKWKEKWRSTKTTVKKEANQQRRQLERELDAGRRAEAEMNWADFVKDFLDKHVSRKPASTLALYKHCLDKFGTVAKPRRLAKVTHAMLEDFAITRLKDKAAVASVNRDLRHVRAAIRWAKQRGYISEVPDFKGVFIREDRKKPVIIPEEDFMEMVKALRKPELVLRYRSADWWRMFLYAAYYLGLRRGEILGLTWGHVSLETLEVRVVAPTSKSRNERVVPMSPDIAGLFREWKEKQPDAANSNPVLPWPYDHLERIYEDWHAIQKAAGVPDGEHYVPKNCRSTCASGLIAANVPTVVVRDFLGHASVATTEDYYINTKPALRAAANARKVRLEGDGEKKEDAKESEGSDGKM
jgi:integrase